MKIPLLGKPSASPHEMTNDLKLLDVVIILSVQLSNLWNSCGDWLSKVFLAATTAPQDCGPCHMPLGSFRKIYQEQLNQGFMLLIPLPRILIRTGSDYQDSESIS